VVGRDRALELAYDAAEEILKGQDATLGNTRTRASNLLTVAALLTSFSAGLGLIVTDPAKGAVLSALAAWLLLGVLVVMGALVLFVLWPVRVWHFGPDPKVILERCREGQTESDIREYITGEMIAGIDVNRQALVQRQRAFRCAVIVLLAEVCILIGALAV
jgi:hypothetical protein